MTNVDAIPEGLRSLAQWVCWTERERGGKPTKVPVASETGSFASVQDSGTWTSFERAVERAADDESIAGVGFVFTEDDPFVGVDLDDCRDGETGDTEQWAQEIIEHLDSFTEVSPSGTGFHVFVRGELPDGGNRSGNLECYESARFFTVTGERFPGTPTEILERHNALVVVHAEHIAAPETNVGTNSTSSVTPSMEDEELLERAMAAKNGPKFTRLWNGDTSGYDSHSEADMALCCLLAFWTQKDSTQMDRLFRGSGLYRAKWDDSHYSGGKTYGQGTVDRAISVTSDVYEPSEREEKKSTGPAEISGPDGSSWAGRSLGNGGSADVNHSVMPVHDEVSTLKLTVSELRQANASLEVQHEHLYNALEAERSKRQQLAKRVDELEALLTEESVSWLDRVFG